MLEDPYESKFVMPGKSSMGDNAGDGLFLKKDVIANTTISFYNGIRVKPGEISPFENSGYQIYVDWNKAGSVRFFHCLFTKEGDIKWVHIFKFALKHL